MTASSPETPEPSELPATGKKRLFYALWPDEAVRRRLVAVQRAYRQIGRPVPGARIHLTVLFLGNADPERAAEAGAAAAASTAPFRFELDTLGYFAKSRVVWAGASFCPDPLRRLHRALCRELRRRRVTVRRRGLAPHLTLFRKARPVRGVVDEPPVWAADRLTLVSSELNADGPVYTVEAAWPFGRPPEWPPKWASKWGGHPGSDME